MKDTEVGDFIRKVAETFATRIGLILISLATSIIVTRILGPEGRGQYAVAVSLGALIAQFGNFGLQTSNTYNVARDRTLLGPLLGNALAVSLLVGGASALVAGLAVVLRPDFTKVGGVLLVLTLVGVPLGLAQMLTQNLLIGLHELRSYNKLELAVSIITAALIGGVILLRIVTVETIFLTGILSTVISLVWSFSFLKKLLTTKIRISYPLFVGSLRYGLKAYLTGLFAFSLLRIDVFMVRYILGEVETGYYALATSMADMLYLLPSVVGMVLFPKLSATLDRSKRWAMARNATLVVLAVMTLLSVSAALFSGFAINLVYGRKFFPAVAPFIVLSAAMICYGGNNIISGYLASEEFPWIAVWIWPIAAVVNIVLNAVLIPSHGIAGAAAASLVCYTLVFVIQYAYALRIAKAT